MMKLRQMLLNYTPCDMQEAQDRQMMLDALDNLQDVFTRKNQFAHFTASSWIVNQNRDHALMAYHNIYRTWAWTGGHADGETDLMKVAIREAQEETGIADIGPFSGEIYSIEVLPVNPHVKRGSFVSAHLHLNVTFLLVADDRQKIQCRPDENSAVAWLPLAQAENNPDEPYMSAIYRKLNGKLPR